jgi:Protein of unknown function (DUF3455)
MMIRLHSKIAAGFIALTLASSIGFGMDFGQSTLTDTVTAPPVPPDLQPPAGAVAFLVGHATGTQSYVCLPSASGFAWTFFAPQATLFQNIKWLPQDLKQQIVTHFLSPNPFEKGLPRATWQSSFDTSAVWAKLRASTTDPAFVAQGAIPWLLLDVVGAQRGPTEGAVLTPTTFIQRLNTHGGVAPSAGCSESSNVGATALVPYTADYFFYKGNGK